MGLNLCKDQRKINMSLAISDAGYDDSMNTNKMFWDTESLNTMNVLKKRETNQHDSYHSGVDTEMKPASLTMQSSEKMYHCHNSSQLSDRKSSSNPSTVEAETLVSSTNLPRAISAEGSLGKKENMNEIVIPLVTDEWGKDAEAVVIGSENLRCTISLPLLNIEEKDLIPELTQKVINSNTETPLVEKNISKTPSLYRSTSFAKWRESRITKESDAIRKQLNYLLEEVGDDLSYTEDSSTSLKSSLKSDEDAKRSEVQTFEECRSME